MVFLLRYEIAARNSCSMRVSRSAPFRVIADCSEGFRNSFDYGSGVGLASPVTQQHLLPVFACDL